MRRPPLISAYTETYLRRKYAEGWALTSLDTGEELSLDALLDTAQVSRLSVLAGTLERSGNR